MSSAYFDMAFGAIEHLTEPEKIELIERLARSLRGESKLSPVERKAALVSLCAELDALPVANPSDGWSNRDHDSAIYGNER